MIVLKEEPFEKYLEVLHHGEVSIGIKNYFGNLLLAPGPGYIEKNFLLTVFKFIKNIFMLKVVDKLGFKSIKAKEFVMKCRDHHLSWQIAMMYLKHLPRN